MFPVTVPAIGLLLSLLWSGCATSEPTMPSDNKSESVPAPAIDPASVELTKPMHFTASDGSDVVAAAGTYHVDGGEGSQLLLFPGDGATPIVIAALMSEHDLDLLGPLALIIPTEEERQHLVLIQPGRTALDAIGNIGDVRSRGPLSPVNSARIAGGVQSSVVSRPGLVAALGPATRLRVFNYQLTPAPTASGFTGCVKPTGWVSAAVASSAVAPAGSATYAGPGTATGYNPYPAGSPWNRGSFPGYHCAFGSVTVASPDLARAGGRTVQLRVTSYVFGVVLSMNVTDVYQQTSGGSGTVTFQQVIVATGQTGTTPIGHDFVRDVTQYYASAPTGSPVKFDVFVDGVSMIEKSCLLKVSMTQAATLKCQ